MDKVQEVTGAGVPISNKRKRKKEVK